MSASRAGSLPPCAAAWRRSASTSRSRATCCSSCACVRRSLTTCGRRSAKSPSVGRPAAGAGDRIDLPERQGQELGKVVATDRVVAFLVQQDGLRGRELIDEPLAHDPPRPGGGGRRDPRRVLEPRSSRARRRRGGRPACSRAKLRIPERWRTNASISASVIGSVVADRPQLGRDPEPVALHALVQVHQGARQVGEGPVEVRAAGLLDHLLQGVESQVRGAEADQAGDLARVLAQVAAQREHRLGRRRSRRRTGAAPARTGTGPGGPRPGPGAAPPRPGRRRGRRPRPVAGPASRACPSGPPGPPTSAALLLYSAIGSSRSSRSDILRNRLRRATPSLP